MTNRQCEIMAAYDRIEAADPDISTERLLAMVGDDTGADEGEIAEALMAQDGEDQP